MRLSWDDFENYLSQMAKPEKPVPPDLGIVRALMLWPDDVEMREQSATRAFLDYFGDVNDASPDVKNSAYQVARSAIGAKELEKAEDDRVPRGLFVGSILFSMINCVEEKNFSFAYHVGNCNKLFLKQKNKTGKSVYRFSKKTFDNDMWPTFRAVSHYWAASYQHIKISNEEFPCAIENLQRFLALAEFIRGNAESRRPFKSPSAILRTGEALRLPLAFTTLRLTP